jgi:hypothetical protein
MPETTRHPPDYRWRGRFPEAAPVLRGEGGGVYATEDADARPPLTSASEPGYGSGKK